MKIIDPHLKFNGSLSPLDLNRVTSIALHHIEHSTADVYEVHRWHLNNTWAGIGYAYFVDKEGNIFLGRGLNKNAGVLDCNGFIVSVAFQGNYMTDRMPDAQFNAGGELIQYLKNKVPTIKYVDGHCRWNPTSCPGEKFPLAKMINAKPKQKEVVVMEPIPQWKKDILQWGISEKIIDTSHEPTETVDLATLLQVLKNIKLK